MMHHAKSIRTANNRGKLPGGSSPFFGHREIKELKASGILPDDQARYLHCPEFGLVGGEDRQP